MRRWLLKWAKRLSLLSLGVVIVFLGIRIADSQSGPSLQLWHSFVPDELRADAIDRLGWGG